MTANRKQKLVSGLAISGTVILSLTLVSIPTDTLLGTIGSNNAYLFMFLIAFVGSITTFASIPYPLILLGLVSGGLHPLLVCLASAAGVTLADSCTFLAARQGRFLLPERFTNAVNALTRRIERHPQLLTPGLMLYGTLSPLSNDFAVISLSLMRYRYRQVVLPLAVGNIMYSLVLAYLGVFAYDLISAWI